MAQKEQDLSKVETIFGKEGLNIEIKNILLFSRYKSLDLV